MTDLRKRLLAAFQAEHKEHLEYIRAALPVLRAGGTKPDADKLNDAFRRAHSLKGAARAVGLQPIETLAHRVETLFARVRDGQLRFDDEHARLVRNALDAIEDWVAPLMAGQPTPDIAPMIEAIEQRLGLQPTSPAPGAAEPDIAVNTSPSPEPPSPPVPEPSVAGSETVRIEAQRLDQLMRTTGALLTENLRQETLGESIVDVHRSATTLHRDWAHVRSETSTVLRQLREQPEYVRLIRYLDTLENRMRGLTRQIGTLENAQAASAWNLKQYTDQLQQDLRAARMVPASSVFEGFRKMVRDLARDSGKQVELEANGLDIVADRMVLQALKDPVMHLLRNAVSHGIETPRTRRRAGKPEQATVRLALTSLGNLFTIEISDDGAGLDKTAIARRALDQGLIESNRDVQTLGPEEIQRILFTPGFSTAAEINEVAGRGMGLSVVQDTVRQLQGEIELPDRGPSGFCVRLRAPLSLSMQRFLLVDCAGQIFALPMHGIDRLVRVRPEDVTTLEGASTLFYDKEPVPLVALARLLDLGGDRVTVESTHVPVALIRVGQQRLAVAVDRFGDELDAVIKDLIVAGDRINFWFSGGIVLGSGRICLVVNPAGLVRTYREDTGGTIEVKPSAPAKHVPSILVVDDSFTTRTLEQSILEARGYRVRIAVDGIDALNKLRAEPADIVVTDIQMPRMDGFALVKALKEDDALKHIPVIIVTSLETREERERGLHLGAEAYVVKRKFDQVELLETIEQLL